MLYNTSNQIELSRLKTKLEKAIEYKKIVDFKVKMPIRSIQQNRYLHLILNFFAIEYGDKMEYVKQEIFKKTVNKELFKTEYTNKKTGEIRIDWRSSASLDSKEMTLAIDRFRTWSGQNGIYLPAPNETAFLQQIEIEIQKYKEYL